MWPLPTGKTAEDIFLVTVNDNAADFKGAGTSSADPFEIVHRDQLNEIKNNISSYFKQMNDLDLDGFSYDAPSNFNGEYDGNHFAIRNWTETGGSIKGFFGALNSTTVLKNIVILDAELDVGSSSQAGILAYSSGSADTVQNIYVTGSVTSTSTNIGGVIGICTGITTFENVHFRGSVTGDDQTGGICGWSFGSDLSKASVYGFIDGDRRVGGIVGLNQSADISEAYNHAYVEGTFYIGGIVGLQNSGTSTVSYSMNKGEINTPHNRFAGGIIGTNEGTYTVTEVINVGLISCNGSAECAGLVGYNSGTVTASNSYTNSTTSLFSTVTGTSSNTVAGTVYTNAQMKDTSNFSGLNGTYWNTDADDQYPMLDWRRGTGSCSTSGTPFGGGSGWPYDPYLICSAAHLEAMNDADYSDNTFLLMSDIDLGDSDLTPISDEFDGQFFGNHYTLSDWSHTSTSTKVGLFQNIGSAVFEDLNIDSFTLTGNDSVSALGYDNETESNMPLFSNIGVSNSTFNSNAGANQYIGAVVGLLQGTAVDIKGDSNTINGANSNQYVGGLFGAVIAGEARRVQAVGGTLTCKDDCGGITGYLTGSGSYDGEINQAKSTITITTSDTATVGTDVGGIVGYLPDDSAINHAYYQGTLSAFENYGGLLGSYGNSATADVNYTWVVATIDGNGTCEGLIFGENDSASGAFTESYADTQASSITDLDGCNTDSTYSGQNTATMQGAAQYSGWDSLIWDIPSGSDYPRFLWE